MVVGGGANSVGIYTAFGTTDYWVWGFQGGKCGGYTGGGLSDAAQQLNYKFNHPIAAPSGNGYFTDVSGVPAEGDEYPDVTNPGPYCDYKIFFFIEGNTGIWPCLSPTELNYYLSTMPYIISDKKPEGKTYVDVNVTAIISPLGNSEAYWHSYLLNYGIFHISDPSNH